VKSDFDPKTLQDVARIAGGQYFRAENSAALQDIYAQIDRLQKSTVSINKYREYADLFPWFTGAALACLGFQMTLSQTLWRRLP
jgi:Ca-activated chloride channel family protein